jgi:hypothetical protein
MHLISFFTARKFFEGLDVSTVSATINAVRGLVVLACACAEMFV